MTISLQSMNTNMVIGAEGAALSQSEFLQKVKSDKHEEKVEAWYAAKEQKPETIAVLADLIGSADPDTEKCAEECITMIVHSVGKSTGGKRRGQVNKQLIALVDPNKAPQSRMALRLLSLIAEGSHVSQIAQWVNNKDLFEDAVFCIERIPGKQADQALLDALHKLRGERKERICVALGHRQVKEAMDPLCKLMQSSNEDVAIKAAEAVSRLGIKAPEWSEPPEFRDLSPWHKTMYMDSVFRYCDTLITKKLDVEFARNTLTNLLTNPDFDLPEHVHCAAMVSLSQLDEARSVQTIAQKLQYQPSYIVRKTAENVLISMEGDAVKPALQDEAKKGDSGYKKKINQILEQRKS
jgi:hypothetical protein